MVTVAVIRSFAFLDGLGGLTAMSGGILDEVHRSPDSLRGLGVPILHQMCDRVLGLTSGANQIQLDKYPASTLHGAIAHLVGLITDPNRPGTMGG
jgi:hypothetical protein